MIRRSVVVVAMAVMAGTALAQAPSPSAPSTQQWHGHHGWKDAARWRQKMEQRRMDRLALLLDLTPAQRRQVQSVFADEHAKMKPAMEQVRQAMRQAHAAHRAARKETLHRLASVLSPAQMKKFQALMPEAGRMHGMIMHEVMWQMMTHDMGHGMGCDMGYDMGMGRGMGMGPPPPGAGPQ